MTDGHLDPVDRDRGFLFDLSDRLRGSGTVEEILSDVVRRLGSYLDVSRCAFAEIDVASERIRFHRDHGLPSLAGTQPLSVLGNETESSRGETLVIENAATDPRTTDSFATTYQPLGLRAAVSVPLIQEGTWIATLLVGAAEPRVWNPRAVSLVEQVAERVGFWLEYVRTVAEARRSEGRALAARDAAFATRDAAFDEIRMIAARIGPEINNPLAVVVANASYVMEELRSETFDSERRAEAIKALGELETAAARIARIVANLQQLQRPGGEPPVERRARPVTMRVGKILAVDDDPMVLQAVRRMLREHDVLCLSDAADAIARLDRGEQFDLILSDVMMPLVTGMDLYEHLRQHHPDLVRRLVFLSGGSVSAKVTQFLESIPNVCLEKPIIAAALREFVTKMLTKRA